MKSLDTLTQQLDELMPLLGDAGPAGRLSRQLTESYHIKSYQELCRKIINEPSYHKLLEEIRVYESGKAPTPRLWMSRPRRSPSQEINSNPDDFESVFKVENRDAPCWLVPRGLRAWMKAVTKALLRAIRVVEEKGSQQEGSVR
jgi:hypothetical protein